MMNQQQPAYGPIVGDQVRILGQCEVYRVVHTDDLALITLESRHAKQFKAGRKALELVARSDAA
ncbi:hypothetical protein [Aquisalimonas sp.]|uniref:hypothetical protein n=1 Tax=Aquisalimonas sp. TaxID=1872621 RepID=UPI0025BC4CE9|nr:hypothetical protein [Aquisalimonas sp.]